MPGRDARGLAASIAVVVALAASACGTAPTEVITDLDPVPARVAQVEQDVAAVAAAQAVAVGQGLPEALEAIRLLDEYLPLLQEGETIDSGLARVGPAHVAMSTVDVSGVRPATREVAFAVDRGRVSLKRAEAVLQRTDDIAYLAATDVLLLAVRDFAAAQDALAQVVERHLPTYRELSALAVDFGDRRRRFRSADEAADAFSVEARDLLRLVVAAQADLATFIADRDAAATTVNEAQTAAGDAFRRREGVGSTTSDPASPGAAG